MVEAESGRSGAVPDRVGPWRTLRGAWPASLVLVGALILTLGVWEVSRRMVEAEAQNRLDDLVSNARETLERRIDAYVQVLRGTAALFAASDLVTRDEFREYVALLDVRSRYPGILRIGYAHRVSAAGKASLSAEAARRGVPGLKASPDGERSESYVVMYLEPFEPAAAPALGFDMLSDPLRRAAMERALRSGEPAVTEKTILLADLGEGRTPGIVIFMPVYHRNEGGGAQRGASQGFVFASFHTAELMQEVFRTGLPAAVDLDVFDGMQVSRDHLIFDRDGIMRTPDLASRSRLSRTISLPVAGRTWTLVFSAPSDLVSAGRRYLPGLVLVGGILISGVLFVTALEQTRARARAERAAAGLRRSEYLLREANERFELAAAAVNSVIYDRMIGERTVVWRGGVTELFGYPPEEVQPTIDWWLEHLHPDDRKRVYAEMRRAVRRGGDFVGEYRFRARDGEYREVWDRCRILRDPEGHAVRMVGSIVNVTELKRAEAAVREAEARHRAILESALDAVIAMDHEGRITEFNPAAERMFGYAREAVVKKEMAALIIPPALQDLHRRGLRSYLETGEAAVLGSRIEITGMRSDGTEFPAEVSVTRIAVGGPPMFTAYIRDLTEHKRAEKARMSLEDQLRQAQKMEAVGRLAGGVAHDFNNLLTVITGRAHLLLTRLATSDPGRRDAELIQKTTQRAVALTGKLLAFSRKQVLQPKVLDLNTVVADVAPMLQRMIGEDVELTLVPGEGLGRVIADLGQIEQVLMNLAVNARDAMPHGGRLTIATRVAHVDPAGAAETSVRPGPYVALSVTDSGTGMDADTQAHLFEPFFTTKEPSKGTGLGLSTVYGIVQQSGGHIEVESEVGRGSTFTVYLPLADEAAAPAEVRPGGSPARAAETARTILLVDDEPEVRELAGEVLRRVGYSVLEASGGGEALEMAARHPGPIHMLVSDVVMPRMSGRDLAQRLKEQYPGLVVLLMSGFVNSATVRETLPGPGVAFLPKPFTPTGLAEKVREVLAADQPA